MTEAQRRYAERHPDRVRESQRRYREKHRERMRTYFVRYRSDEANRRRERDRAYRQRFKISLDEYETRLAAQGGCCAICRRPPRGKRLAVDHCHETGQVRGLLCSMCNRVLGMVANRAEVLRRAAEYLGG